MPPGTEKEQGQVFLSYVAEDSKIANRITLDLEKSGVRTWSIERDVLPGFSYGDQKENALRRSHAVVFIASQSSIGSPEVMRELLLAHRNAVPVVPVLVYRDGQAAQLPYNVQGIAAVPFTGDYEELLRDLLRALPESVKPRLGAAVKAEVTRAAPAAKGYVFLSYARSDAPFVGNLKGVLEKRGYAYWDYAASERDYHGALYRELEERIEKAAAFIAIVSDRWRETEWTAAEYLYARDAGVPVFVVQCEALSRPFPMVITPQTRIDMSADFTRGAEILDHELERKGL
jgi:hypothetical protein